MPATVANPEVEILASLKDEASLALENLKKLGGEVAGSFQRSFRTDHVNKLGPEFRRVAANVDNFGKEVGQSSRKLRDLNKFKPQPVVNGFKRIDDIVGQVNGELAQTKGLLGQITPMLSGVGATFALGAAIKETAAFNDAIAEVSTLVDTSVVSVDDLKNSVRELSAAYGQDTVATAKALYQTISAGANAGADANELMNIAMKLSIGGVTDVETAVDGLTTILNSWKLTTEDAGRVADVMFATMKSGRITIGEISSYMFQAAPIASTMGISLEEVSAALIALTKQGTPTAESMTRIRAAIQGMATDTQAVDLFKRMGFASSDAAIRSLGLEKALNAIYEATGGNVSVMQSYLGSVEAVQAVTGLTGEKTEIFVDALHSVNNAAGEADVAVGKMMGGLGHAMKLTTEASSQLLEVIGDTLAPLFRIMLNIVREFSEVATRFLRDNQELMQWVLGMVVAIGSAWGTILALKIGMKILALAGGVLGLTKNTVALTKATQAATAANTLFGTSLSGVAARLATVKLAMVGLLKFLVANPIVAAGAAIAGMLAWITIEYIKMRDAQADAAKAERDWAKSVKEKEDNLRYQAEAQAKYRKEVVATYDDLGEMDLRSLKAYRDRIKRAKEANEAERDYLLHMAVHGETSREEYAKAAEQTKVYEKALQEANSQLAAMNEEAEKGYIFTNKLLVKLSELESKAAADMSELGAEIAGLNLKNLEDMNTLIQALGTGSKVMAEQFEESVSGIALPELVKLHERLNETFEEGAMTMHAFGAASEAILGGLFEKYGVQLQEDLEDADEAYNAGMDIIIESGKAKSSELRQLIEGALSDIQTGEGFIKLEEQLTAMFEKGAIEAGEYEYWLEKVREAKASQSEESIRLQQEMEKEANAYDRVTRALSNKHTAQQRVLEARRLELETSLQLAETLKQEERAARLRTKLAELEVDEYEAVAKAKREEAKAAQEYVEALQKEAEGMEEVSEAHQQAIVDAQALAISLDHEADMAEKAADAADKLAAAQRRMANQAQGTGKQVADTSQQQRKATEESVVVVNEGYNEQADAAEILSQRLADMGGMTNEAADNALNAIASYTALDESTLNGLRGQVESLRASTESLSYSIHSTVVSLQDELDAMNERYDLIERRRFEEQMSYLRQQAEAAGQAGDSQAASEARESMRLAEEIHNRNMESIYAEQQEKSKAQRLTYDELMEQQKKAHDARMDQIREVMQLTSPKTEAEETDRGAAELARRAGEFGLNVATNVIQVEIQDGGETFTGTFPADQEDGLLATLQNLQRRS